MKKGKQPILYILSSVASWVVDTGLYALLRFLLGPLLGIYAEPVCNLVARALSSFFNFNLNNVICWTKYSGMDPEVSSGAGSVAMDNSQTPRAKQVTFGVSVAF